MFRARFVLYPLHFDQLTHARGPHVAVPISHGLFRRAFDPCGQMCIPCWPVFDMFRAGFVLLQQLSELFCAVSFWSQALWGPAKSVGFRLHVVRTD